MGEGKQGKKGGARRLTTEQEAILAATGNLRINAVAGSGKTTTLIEYARTRPPGARILYLAFNKTVRQEAVRRFAEAGLPGITVETAHSLAYRHVVFRHGYRVRPGGYKTHEVAALLGLKGNGEKHAEYIIANHINKFIAYFCNSAEAKVAALDYRDTVTEDKARAFVHAFYPAIEEGTRLLLSRMNKGEIEITHDFYLKKFQLQAPQLPYDYLLFDEGQDASGAMLDLFLRQPGVKVIVGDTHQQIYSWRYAVNALEQVDFQQLPLSTSFRFPPVIASLASTVVGWKRHLQRTTELAITGSGPERTPGTKATVARTNLGLLLQAIEFVSRPGKVPPIYFEGNLNSYTYGDEGTSLYDVLHLYNGRHQSVRDPLLGAMRDLEELEEYIEKTEDPQLGMMVEIVREYGNDIPGLLKTLKEKHTGDEQRDKAGMVFSTVHRCKGMEYDEVRLAPDFLGEARLLRMLAEKKEEVERNAVKWNEEINLLYVALTRTRSRLMIPDTVLPPDFPPHPLITVTQEPKKGESREPTPKKTTGPQRRLRRATTGESAGFRSQKDTPKEANRPWTKEMDGELTRLYRERVLVRQIARQLGRSEGAVLMRIRMLELEDW